MAADALAAYRADTAAGKDALLVCDTTEMADALNQRLHHDTVGAEAATVTGARGHRIAVGDLIISRRNDPTVALRNTTDSTRPSRPGAQRQPLARRRHRPRRTTASPPNASTTAHAPSSTATTCASTSPTATPSPCTPPKASPPTPPTRAGGPGAWAERGHAGSAG